MSKYRTAQGKLVDMSALQAKNERTRAVGNMKVNARGDTIDSNGKIIVPVTTKVNSMYSKTVGNKSANKLREQIHVDAQIAQNVLNETLTVSERELEDALEDDIAVEKIKAMDVKKYYGNETSICPS